MEALIVIPSSRAATEFRWWSSFQQGHNGSVSETFFGESGMGPLAGLGEVRVYINREAEPHPKNSEIPINTILNQGTNRSAQSESWETRFMFLYTHLEAACPASYFSTAYLDSKKCSYGSHRAT